MAAVSLFETPIWPPWRHVKTLFYWPNWQYCCHSAIADWCYAWSVTSEDVRVPFLCVHWKTKKKFLLFFPSMQCSQSWCWTKRCSPVPWVPEDTFSYWYWWFAAKPRQRGAKRQEKRMTSGHRSYESHIHAILGSYYVIKTVWSWCACLFSLTLTAEMWSYMTLRLICYAWKKNCAKAYLKRKVLLKIVTNSFPKKYTLGFKYIKRREVSWEVPTVYGFRSQQDKKNFRSATLVLLY